MEQKAELIEDLGESEGALEVVPPATPIVDKKFNQPFYKEWFKTSSKAGFISLSPWLTDPNGGPVGKLAVEIGKVDNDNNVASTTKCYVDAVEIAVYLRAITSGSAEGIYPKRSGTYSPESFVTFGGSAGENPVSRILKIEWWGSNKSDQGNDSAFVLKCGHFVGKVTSTGAIQPDYSQALSSDSIKRTRLQIHEISYKLDLLLAGWAARSSDWYETR